MCSAWQCPEDLSVNASNVAPVRLKQQPKSAWTELGHSSIHPPTVRDLARSPPCPSTPFACRSVGNTRHPAKTSSGTVQGSSSEIILLPQHIRRSLTRCVVCGTCPVGTCRLAGQRPITSWYSAAKVWCMALVLDPVNLKDRVRLSLPSPSFAITAASSSPPPRAASVVLATCPTAAALGSAWRHRAAA